MSQNVCAMSNLYTTQKVGRSEILLREVHAYDKISRKLIISKVKLEVTIRKDEGGCYMRVSKALGDCYKGILFFKLYIDTLYMFYT